MNAETQEDEKRLDKLVEELLEHYDSVRVFVTRYEGNVGTIMVSRGGGNWCAQVGQIGLFLEEQITDHVKKDDGKDDGEDDVDDV